MIKSILIVLVALVTFSCTSHPVSPVLQSEYPAMSTKSYNRLIKTHTLEDKKYQFLDNNYIVSSTLLNSEVKKAMLQRKSHALQTPLEKVRKMDKEVLEELSTKSEIFLSFYAPIEEHTRLNTSELWQFYLETGGKRYEGTVKKVTGPFAVVNSLYYHHNRFSKPYIIEFRVPMSEVEKSDSRLIITGTLGSSSLDFKALN